MIHRIVKVGVIAMLGLVVAGCYVVPIGGYHGGHGGHGGGHYRR